MVRRFCAAVWQHVPVAVQGGYMAILGIAYVISAHAIDRLIDWDLTH